MEDEIDLRKYLRVLLRHWKIIVGITLAAVVISAGVTLFTPPVYEARATVLCMGDAKALVGMAKAPAVAAGAAEKLAGKLDANERRTGALLGAVSAAARDNLIDITAKSTSPQKAADTANAWTEAYINYATDYYKKLQATPDELKTQVAAALAVYNEKNEALAGFQEQVKRNDTGIACAELLYDVQMLRQKLAPDTGQTPGNALNNDTSIACTELLYDVQMLRQKLAPDSGQTSGNALNQVFYQYQAKAYSMMFPGANIAPDKGQVTMVEIDRLINMLEKEAGISGQPPEVLLHTLSEMRLKKAAEAMTLDEMTYVRDTTRSSYMEAAKQLMNAELARQSPKQQLKLIEIAVPVDTPVTSIKWVNIGIAFVLGLIAGVLAAFGLEYFQNRKRPAGPAK